MAHASFLLPLYKDAACSDADKDRMLRSIFMGRMTVFLYRTGNCPHLVPTSIVEIMEQLGTQRVFMCDHDDLAPAHGFGFPFSKNVVFSDFPRNRVRGGQ